jgi:hypothetical protein
LRGLAPGSLGSELERFGHRDWLTRNARSLGPNERRTVALVVALASRDLLLISLLDPFAALCEPVAVASLTKRLAELSARSVVMIAASGHPLPLGLAFSRWSVASGQLSEVAPQRMTPLQLQVRADQPKLLLKELLDVAAIQNAILIDEHELVLSGSDLETLAKSVVSAAVARGIRIELLRPTQAPIDAERASPNRGAEHSA